MTTEEIKAEIETTEEKVKKMDPWNDMQAINAHHQYIFILEQQLAALQSK